MLIDSTHQKWIWVTAALGGASIGLHAWLGSHTPGGLTGGSTVGLWYGIAGSALMIFAGLLAALRYVPAWWWIGSRKFWLRGHIWLGTLSFVLILCHSGYHLGEGLFQALWIVFGLTLLTGYYGLVLQQVLPRLITLRISSESPYEQIPHLCDVMRRKADGLVESIWDIDVQGTQADIMSTQGAIGAKVQLQQFYEKHVRPYLSEAGSRRSPLLSQSLQAEQAFGRLRVLPGLADVKERLAQLEELCDERRQLEAQQRLHLWLHVWLLVHIPLSVVLLFLSVVHIVQSLYY